MAPNMRTFSGRPWSQDPDELEHLIALLRRHETRSYLEIGARDGDTFHAVMCSLPEGSRGVAVDLPGSLWGRNRSRERLEHAALDLRRKGYEVVVVLGSSRDRVTVQRVQLYEPFDAILIDADHTYEAVREDWRTYGPMGRLVAFHDIDGEGQKEKHGNAVEVPRLWYELKAAGLRTREFITPGSRMGIGVVLQ